MALPEASELDGPKQRLHMLTRILCECRVNRARSKAPLLAENFEIVKLLGGPSRVKGLLLSLPGRDQKVGFLRIFRGVGPKYARTSSWTCTIETFEIQLPDARLGRIAKKLDLSFKTYREVEDFFLHVAHSAGLDGWDLDRMIWSFPKEFESELAKLVG